MIKVRMMMDRKLPRIISIISSREGFRVIMFSMVGANRNVWNRNQIAMGMATPKTQKVIQRGYSPFHSVLRKLPEPVELLCGVVTGSAFFRLPPVLLSQYLSKMTSHFWHDAPRSCSNPHFGQNTRSLE